MGILDTLRTGIKTLFSLGDAPDSGLQRPVTPTMREQDKLSLRTDRRSTIADLKKMQKLDARAKRIYRKLAEDANVGGCIVEVTSAETDDVRESAQNIFDSLCSRLKLFERMRSWIPRLLRDGDLFLQVHVDTEARRITDLKSLAAEITESKMDAEGNFPDPESGPAYVQVDPWTASEIKTFFAWQILHLKWDEEDGLPYGSPLLEGSRHAWRSLQMGEENLTVRRAVRAGQRRHHIIDGKQTDVQAYKELNQDTLENPLKPNQDFFSNTGVEIKPLEGDNSLGEIEDLRYFEGMLTIASGIPRALLSGGLETSINRDVLRDQTKDYAKTIGAIQRIFQSAFLKLFHFQLLLDEINPESVRVKFDWLKLDDTSTESKLNQFVMFQIGGGSFETALSLAGIEGITYEEEVERIRRQIEAGIVPYGILLKSNPDLLAQLGFASQEAEDLQEEATIPDRNVALMNVILDPFRGGRNGNSNETKIGA